MISETVPCNLCGRDGWRVRYPATTPNATELDLGVFRCTSIGYGSHPQIVQCLYCGYVFANPRWVGDRLLDAYTSVEDETYVQEREGRELTFRKHLDGLEELTGEAGGRRLLDVGAYIGVFVETAQEAGWQAWGVEPSAWAVEQAQRRGLRVIHGTQTAPQLAGKTFDVITMWDVIEHLVDPASELGRAYRLLKPGGLIAVHTMDIGSPFARLMGRRWPWLMDMHIHYFTRRTLSQMLHKQGFEILTCVTQGRFLRLGYLARQLHGLLPPVGQAATGLVRALRIDEVAVPVNFGDLFTVYARRRVE